MADFQRGFKSLWKLSNFRQFQEGRWPTGVVNKIRTEIPEERCVSQVVIEAVAQAEGVRPVELTPPLYDVIDPETLDRIFTDTLTNGKVTFNYNSCEINVFSDEYVAVEKHGG